MLVSLAELEGAGRVTSGKVGGSSLGLGSPLGDPFGLSLAMEPLVMEHVVVLEPLVMEHLLVVEGCPVWTSPGDPLEPSLVELEGGSIEHSGRGVVPVVTSLVRSVASSNGSSLSPNTTAVLLVELVLIVAGSIATVLDYLMSPLDYFATY